MRKVFTLFIMLMFSGILTFSQNRVVTGTVTDNNGQPIEGATVRVKGGRTGTAADARGNFTITVPANATLVFSGVGITTQEVAVGNQSTLNVSLVRGDTELNTVVVTALGIRRSRNEIPYAAQQVIGEEVSKNRSSNFINNLSGKVSGLEIRQNNSIGASTNIVLRGVKSLTRDNQALFVVDGVPFNNANTNAAGQKNGSGGYDYGNAAADINPDDIESITVLKGAAASALYGSIGGNGVILITTKKGRKGLGITVNSGISVGSVDKNTLPTYQKEYGGGYGAYYEDATGRFFFRDPANGFTQVAANDPRGRLVQTTSEDASYGAKFDPNLMVYQWDAFDPTSPNFGKATPWVAAPNDPNSFFEHPISTNNSVFVTGGSDVQTFKLGYTRNDEKGILPNSNIIKNIVDFSSTYNITPKLTAGATINFSNIKGVGRYGTGYDGASARNVMTNFREWWEVNVDVKEMQAAYNRSGGKNVTWNWADPTDLTPIYWDNPYFVRYQNYESDNRNRYFGNINLNYKLTSWLNILGRIAVDNYSEFQEERKAVGSVGVPYYSRYDHSWNETNYDVLLNLDKNITTDINIKALLGGNIRRQHELSNYGVSNGGLIVPGLYSLSNSANTPNAPSEGDARREVHGIFGGATLTWRKMITLDGTLRRDVSSTLPAGNNSYYYPSVSLGFAFSELLKSTPWISYGKIRANYAQVGNDAPIYSVNDVYNIIPPFGSSSQTSVASTKNNANLKPERTQSKEIGLEMAFLKNRVGFDVTYYNAKTIDEIVPVTLSTATGYSSSYLNSGTVENKGVELSLYVTPLKTNNFNWTVNVNWTKNRNKVLALFKDATGQEAKNLVLASYQSGTTLNATLNEAYGQLRGTNFIYTNGQKTIGTNGRYLKTATSNEVIGNVNPDWIGGINNSFKYKNIGLSFLIDVRKGGSVFSTDMYYGLATGLYPETAGLNDLGNPQRNSIATGGGFIRPGVTADGKANTIRVSNTNYGAYGYSVNPDAAFVYDASYVKLREAVLTYSIPGSVVSKLKVFKGIDLSIIGRNLWIIHKNLPYSDPEEGFSSGNLQGEQTGAYPTVRTFAFNIKLNF
ncbi:MAG TPA: SusC/RagA family TonB-linked outer membrane protein [Chitinophagaceae bacterium]